MFLMGLSGLSGGFDPLILLVAGLIVEAIIGHLPIVRQWQGNPTYIMRRYVLWCDDKLNRESRSGGDRAIRGGLAVLFLILLSGSVGWVLASLSQTIQLIWILELWLVIILINQRETHANVQRIGRALRQNDLRAAQNNLGQITTEAVDQSDTFKIARSGLEVCANAMARDVVAPVFWYVLFGLPGLLVFTSVSIMAQQIGTGLQKYQAFGFSAARLNDIFQFVPARIAGLLIVIASIFVPTAKPGGALKIMMRDAGKHHSFVTGWPLSAMAGALSLAFRGTHKSAGEPAFVTWVGDGNAKITDRDISLGLYLYSVSCLVNLAVVAGLTAFRMM